FNPIFGFTDLFCSNLYSNVNFASDIKPKRRMAALRAAIRLFGFMSEAKFTLLYKLLQKSSVNPKIGLHFFLKQHIEI
ncbi:MAG: hypothetical protein ACK56L_07440, partial [Pseudanabaena sp.]